VAPNGTRIFLAEHSPADLVCLDVYLSVGQAPTKPPDNVDVAFDWTATHWGTQ
jgi:hypothetical protein